MKTNLECGEQDAGAGHDHGGGPESPNFRSQVAVATEASARCLSAFLAVEWGIIRLCSLMFAYVRFFWKKMFEGTARRQIRANPTKSNQIRPIINISHEWQRFTKA